MRIEIRTYDGKLSTSTRSEIIQDLEMDNFLLIGEADVKLGTYEEPFHELVFSDEPEEEEPKEEEG